MVERFNWCQTYMFFPSAETRVSTGSAEFVFAAGDLRFSLRFRNARFDTFDLCSTEASGSTFVLGARDTLRPDGTLEVGDGGGCGRPSLAGLGSHGCCEEGNGGGGG